METIIANELRERCYQACGTYNRFTQEQLDAMKLNIGELPRDTIEYLGTVVNEDLIPLRDSTFNSILFDMLAENAAVQKIEDVSLLYSRFSDAIRNDVISSFDHSSEVFSTLLPDILKGLGEYELRGFSYDSQKPIRCHDARTIEQCIALGMVAHGILAAMNIPVLSHDDAPIYIEDQTIAQLVVDRPNEHARIPDLVRSRGMNVDIIREILDAPSRVLSEGTL